MREIKKGQKRTGSMKKKERMIKNELGKSHGAKYPLFLSMPIRSLGVHVEREGKER